MSKKSKKTGRGALVRRLRREYGISEHDARQAAEARPGGVYNPDALAARMKSDAQPPVQKVLDDFTRRWYGMCPQQRDDSTCRVVGIQSPSSWCLPMDLPPHTNADSPGVFLGRWCGPTFREATVRGSQYRGGFRTQLSFGLAGLVLRTALGRK